MKYIFITLLFFISGCSSNSTNIKTEGSIHSIANSEYTSERKECNKNDTLVISPKGYKCIPTITKTSQDFYETTTAFIIVYGFLIFLVI